MPVKKYYCDYCDKQFPDTPADRKRHNRGIQHQQAKARWYDSFKFEQQQPHHLPIPSPKPLCFYLVNTGFCRYGDSCKYMHPNPKNIQQPQVSGNVMVGDTDSMGMGVSWDNLPPSLQPPPEVGYPQLPFVDWG